MFLYFSYVEKSHAACTNGHFPQEKCQLPNKNINNSKGTRLCCLQLDGVLFVFSVAWQSLSSMDIMQENPSVTPYYLIGFTNHFKLTPSYSVFLYGAKGWTMHLASDSSFTSFQCKVHWKTNDENPMHDNS